MCIRDRVAQVTDQRKVAQYGMLLLGDILHVQIDHRAGDEEGEERAQAGKQ